MPREPSKQIGGRGRLPRAPSIQQQQQQQQQKLSAGRPTQHQQPLPVCMATQTPQTQRLMGAAPMLPPTSFGAAAVQQPAIPERAATVMMPYGSGVMPGVQQGLLEGKQIFAPAKEAERVSQHKLRS